MTEEKDSVSPELLPDELKDLPPDAQKIVMRFIATSSRTPIFPPYLHKITDRHIDKILEIADKDASLDHQNRISERRFNLVYFVLFLIFIGCLIFYLVKANNVPLLTELFEKAILVLGGIGAGGGYIVYKFYLKRD